MNIEWDEYRYDRTANEILQGMVGQTIEGITGAVKDSAEVIMTLSNGVAVKLYHKQECCEHVSIADVDGDPDDLIGGLVISAEEVTGGNTPPIGDGNCAPESYTWTFYKIETSKCGLWLRWYGESNGYYSESVDVIEGRLI